MELFSFILEGASRTIPRLPEALFTLLVGYVLIKIIIWFLEYFLKLTNLPKLKGILLSVLNAALWVLLIIFIANNLGFTRLAIAISSSVLVLAFFLNNGLAPLITDVVSGIFLCTDGDFKIGSRVRIGKGENATEGVIKEIDIRKIRIKDDDGNTHVLPNAVVDKDEWVVLEKPESKAKKTAVQAAKKAKEIVRNKINGRTKGTAEGQNGS